MKQPKLKNESLFELIQTLTPAEIRYFKLMATLQDGDKSYLTLFDAIKAQPIYDEQKIKEKFRHEKFTNNLHVVKRYLYDFLLKALRACNSNDSAFVEASTLLINLKTLYDKGLYSHCEVVLSSLKRICDEMDLFEFAPAIFYFELLLIKKTPLDVAPEKYLFLVNSAHSEYLKKLKHASTLESLLVQLDLLYDSNEGLVRGNKQKNVYAQLLENPLLKNESNALSQREKLIYNKFYSFYYNSVLLDKTKGNLFNKRLIEILSQNKKWIEDDPTTYSIWLSNYMSSSDSVKNADEILALGKKLRTIGEEYMGKIPKQIQLTNECQCYNKEINTFLLNKNSEALNTLLDKASEFLNENESFILSPFKLYLDYKICYALLQINKHKKALDVINKILRLPAKETNAFLHYIKIIQIIIHVELKNVDFVVYLVRSLYRYLLKKEDILQTERLLLKFIRVDLQKANTQKEFVAIYKKLYTQLLPLVDDPYEQNFFKVFDLLSWLESKIENKPLLELTRQNHTHKRKTYL